MNNCRVKLYDEDFREHFYGKSSQEAQEEPFFLVIAKRAA